MSALSQTAHAKAAETAVQAAQLCARRLDLRVFGGVGSPLVRDILRTGAVRSILGEGEIADFGLVDLGSCSDDELREAAWCSMNAVLIFDPKTLAPIEAKRRALRWWPDMQVWVLPVEGENPFSGGVISVSSGIKADIPRISATMPVNLEENDVERVLASFLPIVQEWVVGIDVKSTDGTREIVERYADRTFTFDIEPWSFAEARNRCIDRCSQSWVFMTEGHESLDPSAIGGIRNVAGVGIHQAVIMIGRDTGGSDPTAGEYFHFPWLFRNHPSFRFKDQNGVHNALAMEGYAESVVTDESPCGNCATVRGKHAESAPALCDAWEPEPICVRMPGVLRTFHKAHVSNRAQRHVQRTAMNREALDATADETTDAQRARALFYSAQEHASAGDVRTAIRRAISYIREGDTFREQVYEAHLRLGEYLLHIQKPRFAIGILRRGLPFDLHRAEIYVFLGDAHMMVQDHEAARQCYAKAAGTPIPNYSPMFVRKAFYRATPWQGLANACLALGELGKARNAARACLSLDPGNEAAQAVLSRVPAA